MIKRKSNKLRYRNIELQQNNVMANDFYANDSNEEFENADEDGDEHNKQMKTVKNVKKYRRMGRHIPYSERQQFHQEMLTSLNRMSDKCALQAMMDIQNFIRKCRDSSEPK